VNWGQFSLIGIFRFKNQASLLDESLTIFENNRLLTRGREVAHQVKDILAHFMFKGDEINKESEGLVQVERKTRLAMIKLLLEPVNLLHSR